MNTRLRFDITPQPDGTTCGPACLHAVYRYYGDNVSLKQVNREVPQLESGGTLAGFLGLHALRRGYEVTIYTCDLQMFDPSWFNPGAPRIQVRLLAQMDAKDDPKLREVTSAYLEFFDRGGAVHMEDITPPLITSILEGGTPIITGLSATWLYRCKRERVTDLESDDVAGEPVGHFVVIHGIDVSTRQAMIADPYFHEPYPASHSYQVNIDRLIGAILLGIVTYDAKLLVIRPVGIDERNQNANPACRG